MPRVTGAAATSEVKADANRRLDLYILPITGQCAYITIHQIGHLLGTGPQQARKMLAKWGMPPSTTGRYDSIMFAETWARAARGLSV